MLSNIIKILSSQNGKNNIKYYGTTKTCDPDDTKYNVTAAVKTIKARKADNDINDNKFINSVLYNNNKINLEYNILKKNNYKNIESKINILIRTSNRPQYFDICINSVLNQKYDNYHIYICYDKLESLSYLSKYSYNSKITYFNVSVTSKEKYRFNLYNNILINKVKNDEWIMFLDDDDKFTHDYVLKTINENIDSTNDLLIWKFMRPDKLIYPININNVICGAIDTTCFCFNKMHINNSKWGDKQCGDFYFFNQLVTNHKFNKKFIDNILTKTIFEDKIASFGK